MCCGSCWRRRRSRSGCEQRFWVGYPPPQAAARRCYRYFCRILPGCNLLVDYWRYYAARPRNSFDDERGAAHVWAGVGRAVHGSSRGMRLGAHRVGIVSSTQLGAFGRSDCNDCRGWLAGAENFQRRIRCAIVLGRATDCSAGRRSVVFRAVECGDRQLQESCGGTKRLAQAFRRDLLALFSCLLRYFFADAFADLELHLAGFLVGVDDDVIAMENFAVENFQGKRILHKLLNSAL